MMKYVVITGTLAAVAVAVMIFATADTESEDFRITTGLASDRLSTPAGYKTLQTDKYEFELPADWQAQSSDVLVDLRADDIIIEATGGKMHDNRFYGYAEPGSLSDSIFPTNIMVHTADSELEQHEYEEALFDIMVLSEQYYEIDISQIHSRSDELGGRPAVTMEYVITYPANLDLPSIRAIETITTVGPTMYSVSFGAESSKYDEHLRHFEHAVRTFTIR